VREYASRGVEANRGIPPRAARSIAIAALLAVERADALWLLLPHEKTIGAYWEAAHFVGLRRHVAILTESLEVVLPVGRRERFFITSGGAQDRPVFLALADHHFPTDADAGAWFGDGPSEASYR
jgi:hypothetical protein